MKQVNLRRSVLVLAMGAGLAVSQSTLALSVALSNDDGWNSIGIQAMKEALEAAGHDVTLAAPLDGQSGSSGAINTGPLSIRKESANEYSVALAGGAEGAEPATSALIAISIAGTPDLLVSGINDGANIGSATQISGTVGAAIAGLSASLNQSVPAIAVSTDPVCDEDTAECEAANEAHFARVAEFTTDLIAHLETKPGFLASESDLLPPGVGLNINYPPVDPVKGVVLATQGRTFSIGGFRAALQFGCYADCAALPTGATVPGGLTGAFPDDSTEVRNSDTEAFENGYITIVPIRGDYTAEQYRVFKSVVSGLE